MDSSMRNQSSTGFFVLSIGARYALSPAGHNNRNLNKIWNKHNAPRWCGLRSSYLITVHYHMISSHQPISRSILLT